MSYKVGTYISLVSLLIIGFLYILAANSLPHEDSNTLGPGYFPSILGWLLIILSLINFFQTKKKEDEFINIKNFKLILLTLLITSMFVLIWYLSGQFYIFLFVYLITLFTIFKGKITRKLLFKHAVISLGVLLSIYVLFDLIINVNF